MLMLFFRLIICWYFVDKSLMFCWCVWKVLMFWWYFLSSHFVKEHPLLNQQVNNRAKQFWESIYVDITSNGNWILETGIIKTVIIKSGITKSDITWARTFLVSCNNLFYMSWRRKSMWLIPQPESNLSVITTGLHSKPWMRSPQKVIL